MATYGYCYNPNYIPQPHFIPGYTGFVPKMMFTLGQSYGQANHQVLKKDPLTSERLATNDWREDAFRRGKKPTTLMTCRRSKCLCGREAEEGCEGCAKCTGDGHRVSEVRCSAEKPREMFIPEHICPSYKGYVSRTSKKIGLPQNSCCKEVMEEFSLTEQPYDIIRGEVPLPREAPDDIMKPLRMPTMRRRDGMWYRFPDHFGETIPRVLWM